MGSYALYRFPHDSVCHLIEQTDGVPAEFESVDAIDGQQGFIMAPFATGSGRPVVVIRPDVRSVVPVDKALAAQAAPGIDSSDDAIQRQHYAVDFRNFHANILNSSFSKIVMARRTHVVAGHDVPLRQLFMRACRDYPRMFVALVSAPQCGTWLMATPEILLSGSRGEWHTMALAGTMRLAGRQLDFDTPHGRTAGGDICWSRKNRFEQQYVADYIEERIEQFTTDFSSDGPYTMRAGDLVHLRTDFTFRLEPSTRIGDVVCALHPTPAVCGIPKQPALDFIAANESAPRDYYSGFAGPLNIDGATSLFVSLRCMRVDGRHCFLYAGGGLLAGSREDDEWNETQAKMATMMRLLGS